MCAVESPFPRLPPVGHIVIMRAADPHWAGVFVEGADDVEMWNRWLIHEPLDCEGVLGVIRALDETAAAGLGGCVGIIDADLMRVCPEFMQPLGVSSGQMSNLVISEKHDNECDLVCSEALDMLLAEFPSATHRFAILSRPYLSFRDAIAEHAYPIGVARWYFHTKRKEFPPRLTASNPAIFDRAMFRLNIDELRELAASEASVPRSEVDDFFANCDTQQDLDRWQVCNGHDVMSIVHAAFASIPTVAERCRSLRAVAFAIRAALDSSALATFPMALQLLRWESSNAPYRCFSARVRSQAQRALAGRPLA